jgi:tetratricopeptide (TPR) repeat protein
MISSETGLFSSSQSCSEWSRQPLDGTYARAKEEVVQRYPEDLRYITGMWHYASGIAWTALGCVDEAGGQLSQLEDIAHNDNLGRLGFVPANDVMKIAYRVLAGELAAKQKAYDEAITHLKEAVNLQDNLPYVETPPWYYPTRQSLGAVLLKAEKPGEADAVYRKDLTVTGSSLGDNRHPRRVMAISWRID